MKKTIATFLGACQFAVAADMVAAEQKTPVLDGYPQDIANKLVKQRESEASASAKLEGLRERYLINRRRWPAGSRVLVAFNGGSADLHGAIARVASKWTKFANLQLDFGYDSATKQYRRWSESDAAPVAHIRIGFSAPGYWSAIGTDSMARNAFPPGAASMNFEGFADGWPSLKPYLWEATVLHEFGHALGFGHEHQQRACYSEIRWTQGPNGEPDVYKIFAAWQGWSKDVVDVNLKPADMSQIDVFSAVDTKSIMFYSMPVQVFVNGDRSPCFLRSNNVDISAGDAQGAMLAYAANPSEAAAIGVMDHATFERIWQAAQASLSTGERQAVKTRIDSIVDSAKPLIYIHIQREADRSPANALQSASRTAGFIAPGIENVANKRLKSGPTPEVRYFRSGDAGYADQAAQLVRTVMNVENVNVKFVKGYGQRVSRNLVEVWLP